MYLFDTDTITNLLKKQPSEELITRLQSLSFIEQFISTITIGEIEMRNDSEVHYREVKFWMDREKTLNLLKDKIKSAKKKSDRILTYGKATNRFKL